MAADGRVRKSSGTIDSEHFQKIYPIKNLPLAYAVFGATGKIISRNNTNIIDLTEETKRAADSVSSDECDDLPLYVERFSRPIQKRLSLWKSDPIDLYPSLEERSQPGSTIAHIFFFGYYQGAASTIDLRFFHRLHLLCEPSITSIDMDIGFPPWIRGSSIVAKLMFDSTDERFSAYRKAFPINPENLTIPDAVEIARDYILACSSHIGLEVDPLGCSGIGGHIHVAKITSLEGFQWIIPPSDSETELVKT